MKVEKLFEENELLREAHFDFEDSLRGPAKVPDLATKDRVALAMWSEWCQIYAGACGLLSKIKSYFSPSKLNDKSIQNMCMKYQKQLTDRGDYLKSKLDTVGKSDIGSVRGDIIPGTNKILAEVSKFLNKYPENKLKKALEKKLQADSATDAEKAAAVKQAEAEADAAEQEAQKAAVKELDDAPEKSSGDGQGDGQDAEIDKNLSALLKALIDAGKDKEKLIAAALALIDNQVGQGRLYKFLQQASNNSIDMAVSLQTIASQIGNKPGLKDYLILLDKQVPFDKISGDHFPNLIVLADNVIKKLYRNNNPVITNTSLYTRPRPDFNFALNLFNKIADNSIKEYFPNLTDKMLEKFKKSLFKGSKIKPSGVREKDGTDNTLYGLIEIYGEVSDNTPKGSKAKLGNNNSSGNNGNIPTFKNFKDAEKSNAKVVHIDGKFQYNPQTKDWEPAA